MLELKRLREERGLNQRELAELSGVDRVTINQAERGKRMPRMGTLVALAEALEVETGDLFPKVAPPLFDPDRPPVLIRAAAGAGAGAAANVLAGIDDHFAAIVAALRASGFDGEAATVEDTRRGVRNAVRASRQK